jgi:NAD(P)-dependent dehydrogenase (short-subunit alcohol dehydrogenase family)
MTAFARTPAGPSVLITGTTSGIGRALLALYVESGAKVISVNRRRVPELEAAYPSARFEVVDVASAAEVEQLMRTLAASDAVPEILVLNAGINRPDNDEAFRRDVFQDVMGTNLYGVLNFVAPLTQLPRFAVPRRVVLVGSMVNYAGNPYALGYQVSKRAASACFEVWARMYADTDLMFQQVILGPVRTAMLTMDDRLPSWMGRARTLFSSSLDDVAGAIARFARGDRRTLIYPLPTYILFRLLAVAQRLVPGFIQGRKTLDGRARRRA